MNQDGEYIKILAIFHWVVAGIAGLCSLLPLLHLFIGIGLVTGSFPDTKGQEPFPTHIFGWFFIIFASLFILCGLSFAACLATAGRFLMQRRRHTFCLVMAGVSCMFVPFGTVLGIFTIIILSKASVRDLFATPGPSESTT